MLDCKELIDIFQKIGGKFVCKYDTRECTLFPQNITTKIKSENKTDIGLLLSNFAYSGKFDDYVTMLPESKEYKKYPFITEPIHDYQQKNTGGFVIEGIKDNNGYWRPIK